MSLYNDVLYLSSYIDIMILRRDIFQALAEPTRRSILLLLASQTITAGAIAEYFDNARSTISRHIQILMECGLIESKPQGREIYYRIKMEKLKEVDFWLDQLRRISENQMDNLETYLTNIQKKQEMTTIERKELRITRNFKASMEVMWDAWTKPEHIQNWWGPNGFSTTVHKMDLRVGGEWLLTMVGPDGTQYPNKSIYREIIPFKKLVFEHFNPDFITTVLFESVGDETRVEWTMTFNSAELLEKVVKAHKADEGLKQNVEKLEKYLSTMA